VRYKIGDLILRRSLRIINGRKIYMVMRVVAINTRTRSAISVEMVWPERYLAWSPTENGRWLVCDGLTTGWEKTFEDAKMHALYPNTLDRMAAICRNGRKSNCASKSI
jgi:hypothetical protein